MPLPFPGGDVNVSVESPQVSTELSDMVRPYIADIREHMSELHSRIGLPDDCARELAFIADEFDRLVELLAAGKCYK